MPLSGLTHMKSFSWSMALVSLVFLPSSAWLFSHPRKQLCWGLSHLVLHVLTTGIIPAHYSFFTVNGQKEALVSHDSSKLKACDEIYHKWQRLISNPLTKELKEVPHINPSAPPPQYLVCLGLPSTRGKVWGFILELIFQVALCAMGSSFRRTVSSICCIWLWMLKSKLPPDLSDASWPQSAKLHLPTCEHTS